MTLGSLLSMAALALVLACGQSQSPPAASSRAEKPVPVQPAAPKEPAAPPPEAEPAELDPEVKQAAELAGAIHKTPEEADAVLEARGFDRDKLETLMVKIAKDPELADQYRLARAESE